MRSLEVAARGCSLEGPRAKLANDALLTQSALVGVLFGEGELPVREAEEVMLLVVDEL